MNANKYPNAVLITGGAKRIGLELAKTCLALGYHVVIHHRANADSAKKLFANDERVFFACADLKNPPQNFMRDVTALPVSFVGLINSASVFESGDLSNTTNFFDTLAINTFVPLSLANAFAKIASCKWIINITDSRARHMSKKYQNYRVSKLFLEELTRQLASLYAPKIRVNAIAPGAILAGDNDFSKKQFSQLCAKIPLGKTGNVNDVCGALRFLIESEYITGAVIPVDGGWGL